MSSYFQNQASITAEAPSSSHPDGEHTPARAAPWGRGRRGGRPGTPCVLSAVPPGPRAPATACSGPGTRAAVWPWDVDTIRAATCVDVREGRAWGTCVGLMKNRLRKQEDLTWTLRHSGGREHTELLYIKTVYVLVFKGAAEAHWRWQPQCCFLL